MARMNLKLRAILAGFLLFAVLAVACGGGGKGGGGGGSDEDQIKATVAAFGKAFNDGKADDLFNLLDSESRKSCNQKDIASLLTLVKAMSGSKKFSATASDIKVTGDKATAKVTAAIGDEKQDPDTNNLVKEGGKWKLAFGSGDCGL
jgi:hypothetical protein